MLSYCNILFLVLLLPYVDFQSYLHISGEFQYVVHDFNYTSSPNIIQYNRVFKSTDQTTQVQVYPLLT